MGQRRRRIRSRTGESDRRRRRSVGGLRGDVGGHRSRPGLARIGGLAAGPTEQNFNDALRREGLDSLVGRPLDEIHAALVDYIAGDPEDRDADLVRSAADEAVTEILESAEDLDDLVIDQATAERMMQRYLIEWLTRLITRELSTAITDQNPHRAEQRSAEIREYVTERLANVIADRAIASIDWAGPDGTREARDILDGAREVFADESTPTTNTPHRLSITSPAIDLRTRHLHPRRRHSTGERRDRDPHDRAAPSRHPGRRTLPRCDRRMARRPSGATRGPADRWARNIEIAFPVADPSTWPSAQTERLLRFLSNDHWTVTPYQANEQPTLSPSQLPLIPLQADAVDLFSGGLDSYAFAASKPDRLAVGHWDMLTLKGLQKRLHHDLDLSTDRFFGPSTLPSTDPSRRRAGHEGSSSSPW